MIFYLFGWIPFVFPTEYFLALQHSIAYARVGQILLTAVAPILVGLTALCVANGCSPRSKRFWAMGALFVLPLPLFLLLSVSGVNLYLMKQGKTYVDKPWETLAADCPICATNSLDSSNSTAYPIDRYYFSNGAIDFNKTVDIALCSTYADSCDIWLVAPVYANNTKHGHHDSSEEKEKNSVVGFAFGIGTGVFQNANVSAVIRPELNSNVMAKITTILSAKKHRDEDGDDTKDKNDDTEDRGEDHDDTAKDSSIDEDSHVDVHDENVDNKSSHERKHEHVHADTHKHKHDHEATKESSVRESSQDEPRVVPHDNPPPPKEKEKPKEHVHKHEHHEEEREHVVPTNSTHNTTITPPRTEEHHVINNMHKHDKKQAEKKEKKQEKKKKKKHEISWPIPPSMRCVDGKLCGTPVCGRTAKVLIHEWKKVHSDVPVLENAPSFFFIDPDIQYDTHFIVVVLGIFLLLIVMAIAVKVELCPRKQYSSKMTAERTFRWEEPGGDAHEDYYDEDVHNEPSSGSSDAGILAETRLTLSRSMQRISSGSLPSLTHLASPLMHRISGTGNTPPHTTPPQMYMSQIDEDQMSTPARDRSQSEGFENFNRSSNHRRTNLSNVMDLTG